MSGFPGLTPHLLNRALEKKSPGSFFMAQHTPSPPPPSEDDCLIDKPGKQATSLSRFQLALRFHTEPQGQKRDKKSLWQKPEGMLSPPPLCHYTHS